MFNVQDLSPWNYDEFTVTCSQNEKGKQYMGLIYQLFIVKYTINFWFSMNIKYIFHIMVINYQ